MSQFNALACRSKTPPIHYGYEVLQQETATRKSATRYKEMPNVLDLFSVKGHWRAGMSRLQKYEYLAARLTPSLVG